MPVLDFKMDYRVKILKGIYMWNFLMRMFRRKKNMMLFVDPWVATLKLLLGQIAQQQVQVLWIHW